VTRRRAGYLPLARSGADPATSVRWKLGLVLDAAERLLADVGYAGVTTRRRGAGGWHRSRELGIGLPVEALVALVMTFNLGIIIERLGGIETGHRELLDWIDQWISR
jgi:hypothetical protein